MNRAEKNQVIEELTGLLSSSNCCYVVDGKGMNVQQVNDLRKRFYHAGITYRVAKNTLIQKSLERLQTPEVSYEAFSQEVLAGTSGLVVMPQGGKLPANIMLEFRAAHKTALPKLKGACIDGEFYYGNEALEVLSKLKTKEELVGDIIAMLQSPVLRVLGALESGKNTLGGVIKTLEAKESN